AKRWVVQFTIDVFGEPSRSTTLASSSSSQVAWSSNPLLMPFAQPSNGRSSHINVARQERSTLVQHLQALESELQQQQPGYQEAAKAYLTLILVKIARLTANGSPPFQAHPLLAEVFRVIEARYAEPISTADVARAVGRSPSYLTTKVRRLTGRTLMAWIAEWRIAEARRLLLQTNQPLTAIAAQIGYRDVSGFIRLFRRMYGISPTEWRRANR
ncbi:helix-turn-helix transcriptional regulator, partial [Leptolyngbya sp. FACHB-36]|uniref:helix-turn-helix transcriptional regulator n=1 Tax=Leptolyngbya sp. FACHB-36 TaxID=2692808 RepID=UPI001681061E